MRIVCGVGVNDADYVVQKKETVVGKRRLVWTCPFYRAWQNMLTRCYSQACHASRPTYIGCIVTVEWLTFSHFRKWMLDQDWEGKQLDKDIIIYGNKVYGPETCAFVDAMTNNFLIDHGAARGEFPVGVCFHKARGKFRAMCKNTFTGKNEHLGYFTDPATAHQSWRTRKHELAMLLADKQPDERVAMALRERFKVQ